MMAEMITAGEYTVENTTQSVTPELHCSFLSSNPHGITDYCSQSTQSTQDYSTSHTEAFHTNPQADSVWCLNREHSHTHAV